jgi:hypothetical protein
MPFGPGAGLLLLSQPRCDINWSLFMLAAVPLLTWYFFDFAAMITFKIGAFRSSLRKRQKWSRGDGRDEINRGACCEPLEELARRLGKVGDFPVDRPETALPVRIVGVLLRQVLGNGAALRSPCASVGIGFRRVPRSLS